MTTTKQQSTWARVWNRLSRIEEILNYDSTQYMFNRMDVFARDLETVRLRVEQLEARSCNTSGDGPAKRAA